MPPSSKSRSEYLRACLTAFLARPSSSGRPSRAAGLVRQWLAGEGLNLPPLANPTTQLRRACAVVARFIDRAAGDLPGGTTGADVAEVLAPLFVTYIPREQSTAIIETTMMRRRKSLNAIAQRCG